MPQLSSLLAARDWTAAVVLLQHEQACGSGSRSLSLWLAYCHWHLGQWSEAERVYQQLLPDLPATAADAAAEARRGSDGKGSKLMGMLRRKMSKDSGPTKDGAPKEDTEPRWTQQDARVWLASVQLVQGRDDEAMQSLSAAGAAADQPLAKRIKALLIARRDDGEADAELEAALSALGPSPEDRCCVAAARMVRGDATAAAHEYQQLLQARPELLAVQVRLAQALHQLECWDASDELLQQYLQRVPDSLSARLVLACNAWRASGARAALAALGPLPAWARDQPLVRHNVSLFTGEDIGRTMRSLQHLLLTARLNLALVLVRQSSAEAALELLPATPRTPSELLVAGSVHAALASKDDQEASRQHGKQAARLLQTLGSAASECDTVPGRQCMASAFFLQRRFNDVCLYLGSVRSYCSDDAAFHANDGQARAALAKWPQASAALVRVPEATLDQQPHLMLTLARAHVLTRDPDSAWRLLRRPRVQRDPRLHQRLLLLVANDAFRVGLFLHALRAFDLLHTQDQHQPEYWEAVRASAAGHLQMVVAGRAAVSSLQQVTDTLKPYEQPEAKQIIVVIKQWIRAHDEA